MGSYVINHSIQINYEDKPCYKIRLEEDYNSLGKELEELELNNRRVCIVTDSTVEKYYLQNVMEILKSCTKSVTFFSFTAGEASKHLGTVNSLYEHLIENSFDRNDCLVALGGGVVGDLTGYAAATYLRGIRFIQLPTTLLSMVDSSIGGKTGVDYKAYKNMIGAFHQPSLVYLNLKTLSTLSDAQFYSGMGEIIKHGLIQDIEYYHWLEENAVAIKNKDTSVLSEMIYRSLLVKKNVVEKDPKEMNERALLNFGHTLGHAIEKYMEFQLLHGECVALGYIAASYISMKKGYITLEDINKIIEITAKFNLPTNIENIDDMEVVNITKLDKKMDSGFIKFILLKNIGNAFIDKTITEEDMMEALQFIRK